MKRCPRCGVTKDVSEFGRDKNRKDGLKCWCKSCKKEDDKKYRNKNREAISEYFRQYRSIHSDRCKDNSKKYYENNKDKIRTKHKAYYAKNAQHYKELRVRDRDRQREREKSWRKLNKDKVITKDRNYRARKRNAEGSHTALDIKHQYEAQEGRCYWCGVVVGDNYHVDHVIPLAKGGSNGPENLVIACPSCNCSKGAKLPHEFVPKVASG